MTCLIFGMREIIFVMQLVIAWRHKVKKHISFPEIKVKDDNQKLGPVI